MRSQGLLGSLVPVALLACAPILASAHGGVHHSDEGSTTSTYIMVLTGGQMTEVPPSRGSSGRFGVGFLTFDERSKILCYSISHGAIPGETTSHFHGPAAPGEESEEHYWPDAASSLPTGSPKDGCTDPLDPEAERALKAGLWFLEIHSADYPVGEIRGQVLPMQVKYGPGNGLSTGDEHPRRR